MTINLSLFSELIVSLRDNCYNTNVIDLQKLWAMNYEEVWNQFFLLSGSLDSKKINNEEIIILQRIYQYLANVLTYIDVREFFSHQFFIISKQFIGKSDIKYQKIKNYSIATLFNYHFNNYSDVKSSDKYILEFVELVFGQLNDTNDKLAFLTKLFMHQKFYAIFPSLPISSKIIILDTICDGIKADDCFIDNLNQFITLTLFDCNEIRGDIMIHFDIFLQDNYDTSSIAYFKNLLDFLLTLSTKQPNSWIDPSQLMWIPNLLKKLCYPQNAEFVAASSQKLAMLDCIKDNEENQKRQSYNMKNVLVRLIGNLVFDNSLIKKEFTDAGVVQALMQCSHLDPLNPFIRECSIFAIRNICQDNKPAQDIIDATQKITR